MRDELVIRRIPISPGTFTIAPLPLPSLYAESMAWLNTEMSKMVLGSDLKMKPEEGRQGSYTGAVVHMHLVKQRAMEDWQRVCAAYAIPSIDYLMRMWTKPAWRGVHPAFGKGKHSGPKWGQPGRGRKRKARLAARAKEQKMQRLMSELRSMGG